MRIKTTTLIATALITLLATFLPSFTANAAQYDKSKQIEDTTFVSKDSMTEQQIQNFINQYPKSCLKPENYPSNISSISFKEPLSYSNYGEDVSPARIIWKASQLWNISPQVILATLEKEQNFVTGNGGCSPWRYNSAMGYNCPDTLTLNNYPNINIYNTCAEREADAGFSRQVNHGAWQLTFNKERADGNLGWGNNGGINYHGYMTQGWRKRSNSAPSIYYDGYASIDGTSVYMSNAATASLYSYTPHFSNFSKIFYDNFKFSDQSAVSKSLRSLATNNLAVNTEMKPGDFITSPNGEFILIMQYTGELAVYQSGVAIWQSGTGSSIEQKNVLCFQADGNLVIYDEASTPKWSSNTAGMKATTLSLQNDGNLVMYSPSGAVWASNTDVFAETRSYVGSDLSSGKNMVAGSYLRSSDWRYYLTMQNNGNLVLSTAGNTNTLWQSGTGGKGATLASMQSDGNLVLYGPKGAIWASNTNNGKKTNLSLQTDGNLVMYSSSSRPIWASNTEGRGGEFVSMQTDGNLVMYGSKGVAWASNTNGNRWGSAVSSCTKTGGLQKSSNLNKRQSLCSVDNKYMLSMQTDGNLVMYVNELSAPWATNTSGKFFQSNFKIK